MAKEYPLLVGHCDRGHKRLRSVNDVADFIMKHGKYGDVNVTFENGRFFLDTYGIYLNNIIDQEYREELLKVLQSFAFIKASNAQRCKFIRGLCPLMN